MRQCIQSDFYFIGRYYRKINNLETFITILSPQKSDNFYWHKVIDLLKGWKVYCHCDKMIFTDYCTRLVNLPICTWPTSLIVTFTIFIFNESQASWKMWIGLQSKSGPIFISSHYLDWEADHDEKEVCRGETGQEGVGWRLEGGLPHHSQDDQDVAAHSEAECEAGNVMSTFDLLNIIGALKLKL